MKLAFPKGFKCTPCRIAGAVAGLALALTLGPSCSSKRMVDDGLDVTEDSDQSGAAMSAADVAPPVDPAAVGATTSSQQARRGGVGSGMAAASIPPQGFERNGSLLNSYYFVRGEASWVDLAQRIYHDPVRAAELKGWNPTAKIRTGAVVFYRSPTRAAGDPTMMVFHQDFGVAAESYTVQQGDTLAKIARDRLGSPASAVEIRAENKSVKNFAALSPGTTIALPPAQVDNVPVLERIAQAQLEEQRRQREMAQNSSPETAGNSGAGVAATTASTESSSSARTPASSDQSPLGRLLEAANGLPVPPQYIAAGLLVFAFCALLLRRRPE